MAPLQRRRERLLPRRGGAAAGAKQSEAVVQPLGQRGRAESADAAGGELERERQPVEPEADAGDVHRVLVVEHEARSGRDRALDEEADRLVAQQVARRLQLLRVGDGE